MAFPSNPFADGPAPDDEVDQGLVLSAKEGNREALEQLVSRHQAWIYNLALRMLYWPQDAEDTTQEVLIKVITKLSTYEGRSSFRTWLYRIVANHVLNLKRRSWEDRMTFAWYTQALESTPDLDLPDPNHVPADVHVLVKEAQISCTSAVLLCLDREQRLIYILADLFGVTDILGGELLGMNRENFRQKLARARRDLNRFTQNECGLINPANPCRCARKTRGFIQAGYVDPQKLIFASSHLMRVRDVAPSTRDDLEALDDAYAVLHREHPFHQPPDFVAALRRLINHEEFQSLLNGPRD